MNLLETSEHLNATRLASGERMLRYFEFAHLPPMLQETSANFAQLAIVTGYVSGLERTAGLRKLLEAKDCIVRAALG